MTHFPTTVLGQLQWDAMVDTSLEKQEENTINIESKSSRISPSNVAVPKVSLSTSQLTFLPSVSSSSSSQGASSSLKGYALHKKLEHLQKKVMALSEETVQLHIQLKAEKTRRDNEKAARRRQEAAVLAGEQGRQAQNKQNKLRDAQKAALKKSIIQPYFETICKGFSEYYKSVWIAFNIFGTNYEFDYSKCSEEVTQAVSQLTALHKGDVNLTIIFADESPSLTELRSIFYELVLEILHDQYPELNKIEHPPIDFVHKLEGMTRIRALFIQYITKTSSGSLERHILAHEITQEKFKLNFPCDYDALNTNIFSQRSSTPGDFSYLDLSHLSFIREEAYGQGKFKNLILHHSNFDGSSFNNICLYRANFMHSSLRGADLSKVYKLREVLFAECDVDGIFIGENCSPDRGAKNSTTYSKTQEELINYTDEFTFRRPFRANTSNAAIDSPSKKHEENTIDIGSESSRISPNITGTSKVSLSTSQITFFPSVSSSSSLQGGSSALTGHALHKKLVTFAKKNYRVT